MFRVHVRFWEGGQWVENTRTQTVHRWDVEWGVTNPPIKGFSGDPIFLE